MILCFGLIRPYKGVDVLLEAFQSVEGAELWVVGRPLGVSLDPLRELARRAPGRVRFVPRFVSDRELPAYFRRADLVVLPHRDAEQSGVLYVGAGVCEGDRDERRGRIHRGGGPRRGAAGAAWRQHALAAALNELLADAGARERLAACARAAAAARTPGPRWPSRPSLCTGS